MPDGLRLALTTLTVARVRGPRALDRRTARTAMELAPLVGLLLGAVAAGLLLLLDATPLLAASLAVTALALLTRGLHLDGLADLVDGLGSYRDPEGTRAVMKAPDVGPLGLVAVVLTLLVQTAALTAALQHDHPVTAVTAVVTAVVTGRLAITWACAGPAAATPTGLGALVAGTVRRPLALAWLVLLGAGAAVAGTAPGVAAGLAVAWLVGRHALRRVGGLTGDVLGALCEVATTAALVALAVT